MHFNKKYFFIIAIIAISGATNCALFREQFSTKARMEKAANYIIQFEEITVKPNPLELHGGNVAFNIRVKAPDKKMKRSYSFTTDIFYSSGNIYQSSTRNKPENKVGSILLEGTKLKRNNIVQKDMSFAYKDASNLGYLYAYGTITKNQGKKKEKIGPFPIYSKKQQVIGVITTSSLVKIPTENEDGKNGLKAYQAIKSATSKEDGSYKTAYELLKNAPNTATNRFNQGLAYLLEGRNFGEAKKALEVAVQLNPKEALTYYVLAIVAAHTKNDQDLINHLKKAISLNPDLKAKAKADVEFYKYWEQVAFLNIMD